MNNKRTWKREKALELRNAGMTNVEIAHELGVSKQRVSQYLATESGVYRRVIKPGACRYKGLREWMNKNGVSMTSLVIRMGYKNNPQQHTNVKYRLTHECMKMEEIKKVLEITGMTFEECFGRFEG